MTARSRSRQSSVLLPLVHSSWLTGPWIDHHLLAPHVGREVVDQRLLLRIADRRHLGQRIDRIEERPPEAARPARRLAPAVPDMLDDEHQARLAALSTARTDAVAMSASIPTPNTVRPSSVRHST
jgi:hypothetical protein